MNHTLKSMLIAATALTAVSASAQDKATLDLLVKKGLITAEDRAKTLEESANARTASGVNRVFPKEDTTKRFTIGGYFQTQYQYFNYDNNVGGAAIADQSGFLLRRLYLELTADLGEGLSGNIVMDTSGNTSSSTTSWLDRAIVSSTSSIGTFDLGYRKVTWGYEESTLNSLFKASSGKLYTVERGITNRYWNESENGTSAAGRSDGRRLGFGAHHTGLHYTSVANPQGFEFGASVVNAAQGRLSEGKGLNDLAYYANVAYNYKVSDNEKYAVGVNWGKSPYFNATTVVNTQADMTGYNPYIQAQYFNWTGYLEYMSTKITGSDDPANVNAGDHTPTGYNATLAYKITDNWEAVARYTYLDTDHRGQKISDGERGFTGVSGSSNSDSVYNKSNAIYVGLNYYFSLSAMGKETAGHNAKVQLGYERATFKGKLNANGSFNDASAKGDVDALRLQAQVAF